MPASSPVDALARVLAVLEQLEIAYSIGGSVASSTHGIPRLTNDVDLAVAMSIDQIDEFCALLSKDFYADSALIRESFAHGRPANLIHYASGYKFDLFPHQNDAFSEREFERRVYRQVSALGETIECAVSSAEDVILRKLQWYRLGGESSEKQWNDLRGVVRTQGDRLDATYLRQWAPLLKVDDLLERLLGE